MATQACSEVTSGDILGLIKGLVERLHGKSAVRWLKYIRKMFRNEDPWVRRRHLAKMEKHSIHLDFYEAAKFMEINVDVSFRDVLLPARTGENQRKRVPKDIVIVKIDDLLSPEQMATFDYTDLVEYAREEYELETCDADTVLRAALVLAQRARGISPCAGLNLCYILCGRPGDYSSGCDSTPVLRIMTKDDHNEVALSRWLVCRRTGNPLDGRPVFGPGSLLIKPDSYLVMALPVY